MFDDMDHGLKPHEREALRGSGRYAMRDPDALEERIVSNLCREGLVLPAGGPGGRRWPVWVKGIAIAGALVVSFGLGTQFGSRDGEASVEPVLEATPVERSGDVAGSEFMAVVDPGPSGYPVDFKEWLNDRGAAGEPTYVAPAGHFNYSPAFNEPSRDSNASR